MSDTHPTFGTFNQGEVPTIACFNQASTPLGVDLDALIAAMQTFVDHYVAPVRATPAKLVKSKGFLKGAWAMVFLDDADTAGALAYHDLTPDGLPESKVFVKTTLDNHDLASVSASHELVEMLVDPAINMMTTGPDAKVIYAYESADPVEQLSFKVRHRNAVDLEAELLDRVCALIRIYDLRIGARRHHVDGRIDQHLDQLV